MDDQELNSTYVYQIGTRTALLMGCERSLLIFSLTLCATAGYAMQSLLGVGISVFLFCVILATLRKMAKYDPMLSIVYRNHVKYAQYYSAHATHFGICNKIYKGT